MALPLRSKKLWLPLAGGLFAISHALPAVVHDSETTLLGAKAALLAVFFPLLWSSVFPLGFLLGLYYPFLGVTLFGVLRGRALGTGTAIALVSTMALWGVCTPPKPDDFLGFGTIPGGHVGLGFWLWLAAGACLLMASIEKDKARRLEQDEATRLEQNEALLPAQRTPRRLARSTVAGLVYAGVVAVAALVWTTIVWKGSRHPTAEELREVEAEKRRMIQEASPDPSP